MEQIRPISPYSFLALFDDVLTKLKKAIDDYKPYTTTQAEIKKVLGVEAIEKLLVPSVIYNKFDNSAAISYGQYSGDTWYGSDFESKNAYFFSKSNMDAIKQNLLKWYKEQYLPQVTSYNRMVKNHNTSNNLGPFGQVFGGDQRGFPEINTDKEQDVVDAVNTYINGRPAQELTNNIGTIKSILKKNQYNDVVSKPINDFIYRGMKLTNDEYQRFRLQFGTNLSTDQKTFLVKPKKPLFFKPINGRGFSSWTSDKKIAQDFATFAGEYGINDTKTISVILVAKTKQQDPNGLFDLNNWYDEMGKKSFSKEQEVLTFGNVLVDKIEVYIDGYKK